MIGVFIGGAFFGAVFAIFVFMIGFAAGSKDDDE